jgi:hypothetical protein
MRRKCTQKKKKNKQTNKNKKTKKQKNKQKQKTKKKIFVRDTFLDRESASEIDPVLSRREKRKEISHPSIEGGRDAK